MNMKPMSEATATEMVRRYWDRHDTAVTNIEMYEDPTGYVWAVSLDAYPGEAVRLADVRGLLADDILRAARHAERQPENMTHTDRETYFGALKLIEQCHHPKGYREKLGTRGFDYPPAVHGHQNPMAHGGVIVSELCTRCGAQRDVAHNAGQEERGDWYNPEPLDKSRRWPYRQAAQ